MERLLLTIFLAWAHSVCLCQPPCSSEKQVPFHHDTKTNQRQELVRVPLVFHIITRTEEEAISKEQILAQLELLNNSFQNLQQEFASLYPELSSRIGNVGFQFSLADIDPMGAETEAIIRSETEFTKIGDIENSNGISIVKLSEEGGSDAWDVDNYINIWVAERSISLGATITNNTISNDIHGIVLDTREAIENTKTIVHEMGHYFGLLHPWGNNTGCDDEDDEISDTPFQAFPNFDCEKSIECSSNILPGNYMDFSSDNCLSYFTRIQSQSMQEFAKVYKSALINNAECFINNLPQSEDIKTTYTGASIEVYMGPQEEMVSLELYNMAGQQLRRIDPKRENYINFSTQGIPKGIYVLVISRPSSKKGQKIFIY